MEHIGHSTIIRVNATPDRVLPLFTVQGECLWIAGWNPEYVFPASGKPETGMIWTTAIDESTHAVWVTVNYDTVQHTATYLKWTPDKHVTRIDIQCDLVEDNKTLTTVSYSLTALSEKGHEDIQKLTKEHFDKWIGSWETAINHYLEFDEILEAH